MNLKVKERYFLFWSFKLVLKTFEDVIILIYYQVWFLLRFHSPINSFFFIEVEAVVYYPHALLNRKICSSIRDLLPEGLNSWMSQQLNELRYCNEQHRSCPRLLPCLWRFLINMLLELMWDVDRQNDSSLLAIRPILGRKSIPLLNVGDVWDLKEIIIFGVYALDFFFRLILSGEGLSAVTYSFLGDAFAVASEIHPEIFSRKLLLQISWNLVSNLSDDCRFKVLLEARLEH